MAEADGLTQEEVVLEVLRNIPWAVAAWVLGREMMRLWAEDRSELRQLIHEIRGEIEEIKERLTKAGH